MSVHSPRSVGSARCPSVSSVPVRRLTMIAALVAVALVSVGAQADESRLVAVGDIHGAGVAFRALLQRAGLVDAQEHWSGGRATLVQTGDYTDRGREVRAVMDLLMRLEEEADDAGGRVEVLLGNHETMNLTAVVRDATPEIFASFADDGSVERREAAYRDYVEYVEARMQALGHPLPDHQTHEEWMEAHPPGFPGVHGGVGSGRLVRTMASVEACGRGDR